MHTKELQKELKLHRNSISKALKDLEDNNLISKQRFFIKDTANYNSRADKSLWQISLLNAALITNSNNQHEQTDQEEQNHQEEYIGQQQAVIINNQNQESVISDQSEAECNNNEALESSKEWECTKYDPACTDSSQLYNKDFVLKNGIIENINYIDAKKEFLENEQSSFPSESYNNSFKSSIDAKSSCSNTTSESAARTIKDISEYKELRHFYPLPEQDIDTLNFRSGREFSNNFMNQLLLKLYIKYPEKRFKNKFTFLSYMAKILKNEKHQGPLVNHTTFRFNCNIGTKEKNLLEYEKYLNQIESSFDTNKEMQVKKKIAGRFSTNVAYKILKQAEFKINHDKSFITALVPNRLNLSERQIADLSEQLEAVYGIKGYYVAVVGDVKSENVGSAEDGRMESGKKEEIEKQYSKIKEPDIISSSKDIGILDNSQEFDNIEENTVWGQIRKGLKEELGEAVDRVWFSKAVAAHCNDTKTLTLTMPTRFMADFIRNNYSHVIRRLSEGCGIKILEFSNK